MIDLRSDTVTQPCKDMRTYMANAPVGDDAYEEDKSVNLLQDYCKDLFGKEEALFVTSGMMANRLAFLIQTSPGDEVITEASYHVNFFDSAPMGAFAGVVMNPCRTEDGILRCSDVERAIFSKQRYDYFSQAKLISIENSINGWAGKIFPFEEMRSLYKLSRHQNISLHLDGARLFNSHVITNIPLKTYASNADTVSVCFSKGLGAPYGSMLMGKKELIQRAKKFRLWLGGGVHQAGMLAAGAYYALTHNLDHLKEDHQLAVYFAEKLKDIDEIQLNREEIETNMVQFSLKTPQLKTDVFMEKCSQRGLHFFPWLPNVMRAIVHRHISQENLDEAIEIIKLALLENQHRKVV
ncbi:MAG: threonine aldolase family protein [Alphaproteobacteria bacterium]|nr:threonine aldolase family protein [Alphaproteobacteria bacterium]